MNQPASPPAAPASQMSKARTVVVVVHGMGEQRPLDTLNNFVKTALPPIKPKVSDQASAAEPSDHETASPADGGTRKYYSRPERITDSYEARRLLAFKVPEHYGQTEFVEYHWSYLMTGNKLSDMVPMVLRILLRRPQKVPVGLRFAWWAIWVLQIVAAIVAVWAIHTFAPEAVTWAWWLGLVVGEGVLATLALKLLRSAGTVVTNSFVDVVRYLDTSPRSYEQRRNIRKGMVDLLQQIHDTGRYSRIVIVAHSLGAYIAYDAIRYLWPTMCNLHAGPPPGPPDPASAKLEGLAEVETLAGQLRALDDPDVPHPHTIDELTEKYRAAQFTLWQSIRRQGNPWLITDFISVGTPMYFADLLYTSKRKKFDDQIRRSELPVCPPQSSTQTVEGDPASAIKYGWKNGTRTVLAHGSPFAVVRWTNLYFPWLSFARGDWFGGPLKPLFGKAILDRPITGNGWYGKLPAVAHSQYFTHPDQRGPEDVSTVLQEYLHLNMPGVLEGLLAAPFPLPETDHTR